MMHARKIAKRCVCGAAKWLGVNALLRHSSRHRLLVLCYHGIISENRPGEHLRTRNVVARRTFAEHLDIVCRYFAPVDVWDVLKFVDGNGSLPDRPVLITFDDGFRNTLVNAVPELLRRKAPALFLVATGCVEGNRLLWTQELDERVLGWRRRTIPLPGGREDATVPEDPSGQEALVNRIRGQCKRMSDLDRETYISELGNEPLQIDDRNRELYEFLSWDDVRSLCDKGFAVGSHTVDHRLLSRLTLAQLRQELTESKATLEHKLGRECPWISYPNGGADDISPAVITAVGDAGYRLGFTLTGTRNDPREHPLEIDRVCIPNQPANYAFVARVSGLQELQERLRGGRASRAAVAH